MMKFKHRIVAVACVVLIGIPYLWFKYKWSWSSRRSPVVQVYEEKLLQTLLLDGAFDLNNLDHRHDTSRLSKTVRRGQSYETGGSHTTNAVVSSKHTTSSTIPTLKANVIPFTEKRTVWQRSTEADTVSGNPWEIWKRMVTGTRVTLNGTIGRLQVDAVLKALRSSRIVNVGVGFKGSQLKASMFLEGSQRTVFKPKRYDRNVILRGNPYEGYDRHNGEIAAFHLDRLLGFYRAPPVSGRQVNLKTEVLPVTHIALKKTFFTQGNNTCFYGVCFYCKREEPACADGDMIEASLTIWLPEGMNLRLWRHPWQRTYSKKRTARWETDPTYCDSVRKRSPYDKGPRLTSVMDTSIFDFLIGNADRHHYETFHEHGDNGLVLHLDNGKSFGNPDVDEMSILAPLYQCCRVLRSTWRTLKEIKNSKDKPLSEMLNESLSVDPLRPVLTSNHLHALDRRLIKIVEIVEKCLEKNGEGVVLVDD